MGKKKNKRKNSDSKKHKVKGKNLSIGVPLNLSDLGGGGFWLITRNRERVDNYWAYLLSLFTTSLSAVGDGEDPLAGRKKNRGNVL